MPAHLKHPSARARRNKASTRATLTAVGDRPTSPELPDRGVPWHPLTLDYWRDVWSSPMASEYEQADVHGLFIVMQLVDQFWTNPMPTLAAEIRLQRQAYGLTPQDRRRLEWDIDRGEAASASTAQRRAPRSTARPSGPDPRSLLA